MKEIIVVLHRVKHQAAALAGSICLISFGCECGDWLQMMENIVRDCGLNKDQKATMMGILSEKRKEECTESATVFVMLMLKM
jgi:hypothetical protein